MQKWEPNVEIEPLGKRRGTKRLAEISQEEHNAQEKNQWGCATLPTDLNPE
jgi:hypothetical protein